MKYIFTFAIVLLASQSYGQKPKETFFGFKGGYNRSIINGIDQYGGKTGYIGGEFYCSFFSDTKLNKHWNFEDELLFSFTDDYHFLEIPLHLKYYIKPKWNVFAGLKVDFILNSKDDDTYYQYDNFGFSTEIASQYYFNKRFFGEIRYSRSIINKIDNLGLDIYDGIRKTIRFGGGLRF